MIASRLLPVCVALLSLACSKPAADAGPPLSASTEREAGAGAAGAGEAGAAGAGEAGAGEDEGGGQACSSDADCVPAECCHPSTCMPASAPALDCSDSICTQECRPGTLDCGKGHCACQDGTCVAVVRNARSEGAGDSDG